jgi:hypothetical protein
MIYVILRGEDEMMPKIAISTLSLCSLIGSFACTGGSRLPAARNMVGGGGIVTPRQEVWFEETDSGDGTEGEDRSDGIGLIGELGPVPAADLTEDQVSERVAEVVSNTVVQLVDEGSTTPGDSNEDGDMPPPVTGTETPTSSNPGSGDTPVASEQDPDMTPEDPEIVPPYTDDLIGKCKESLKLAPDANLPILSVNSGDFVKGELNITQPSAMLVFNSAKNIRRLTVSLDNPEGQYCLDLRAKKLLKNLTIKGSCDANLSILRLAADRGNNVKILGCGESSSVNYVDVSEDIATPNSEAIIASCKAQLSKAAPNGQFKYWPIDFNVTRNNRLDIADQYAVLDFRNAKRINKLEVNLDHPNGKYCVNVSATKEINKITFVTRCANPEAQTSPEVIGLTADSKKVKKLNFKLCTEESRRSIEDRVDAAKSEIKTAKADIAKIRGDKSLTAKEKKEQIKIAKDALKDAQKSKKEAKKDLRKAKK